MSEAYLFIHSISGAKFQYFPKKQLWISPFLSPKPVLLRSLPLSAANFPSVQTLRNCCDSPETTEPFAGSLRRRFLAQTSSLSQPFRFQTYPRMKTILSSKTFHTSPTFFPICRYHSVASRFQSVSMIVILWTNT